MQLPVKSSPLQVMLVDDSAVVRGLMTKALEADPAITIAATAMRGDLALTKLGRQPIDAVILDVEMPVMDGLTTLRKIHELYPRLPVIMFSTLTESGAATSMKALAMGATECVAKPKSNEELQQTAGRIATVLKAVCKGKPNSAAPISQAPGHETAMQRLSARVEQTRSESHARPAVAAAWKPKATPELLVIGSSTGGPAALSAVLKDLPRDFGIPTVIVQHMPPTFTPLLAKHLQADSGRPCMEVTEETLAEPGTTYVAPGGFHVTVHNRQKDLVLKLNTDPPEHFCRPSVNPLFRTAAQACGERLLAVMLTGMGSDGLEGTAEIVRSGGRVIAQDEASSIVWGMPGAIATAGLAHDILPLSQIGAAVARICPRETCLA